MTKVKFIDKNNKENQICSTCEYWDWHVNYSSKRDDVFVYTCQNINSVKCNKETDGCDTCNCHQYSKRYIDTLFFNNCKYNMAAKCFVGDVLIKNVNLCGYYSKVVRKDGKVWAHYPNCELSNCPKLNPKLLCGETPIKEKDDCNMKIKQFDYKTEFVEKLNNDEDLKDGVLYVAPHYEVAIHKCMCGCGEKVVTSLIEGQWTWNFNGKNVSLSPSVGNYNFNCKSHYYLRDGIVKWL